MLPREKNIFRRILNSARFLPTAALLMLTLAVVIYASFIGEGHKKGVLVACDYYFTSNLLGQTLEIAEAEDITRPCIVGTNGNGTIDIEIRNYNAANQYNAFDMTYNVYYWLDTAVDASNPYNYSVSFAGETPVTVTSTMQSLNFPLANIDRPNYNTMTVNFDLKNGYAPNLAAAAGICIAAVPTSPAYMVSYSIGATVKLSDIVPGFSVAAEFVTEDNYTFNDHAGFLYQITTSGQPEDGTTLTVSWDAVKLQLDETDPLYPSVVTGTSVLDGNGIEISRTDSVVISGIGMNELYTLAFFRADGSSAFWKTQLDAQLASLVPLQTPPQNPTPTCETVLDNLVTVTINAP